MRRAGIVAIATVAGFAALMSFHSKPATLSLGSLGAATTTRASTASTSGGSPHAGSGPTGTSSTTTTSSPTRETTTTSAASTSITPTSTTPVTTRTSPQSVATRIVTGTSINYTYGTLAVSVTGTVSHITKVNIASISDGGDSRSQSIDEYAIPILESQALSAQGANIQGVSGASYTSSGFEQSLQSALIKLRQP
jgi:uncharacterized protein with FMN-binding domain